jgi:hypothetical protein
MMKRLQTARSFEITVISYDYLANHPFIIILKLTFIDSVISNKYYLRQQLQLLGRHQLLSRRW